LKHSYDDPRAAVLTQAELDDPASADYLEKLGCNFDIG